MAYLMNSKPKAAELPLPNVVTSKTAAPLKSTPKTKNKSVPKSANKARKPRANK